MDSMKSIHKEELKNSLEMREAYEAKLKQMQKGTLVKKMIKGRPYYYLAYREGGTVKYEYKGALTEKEVAEYAKRQARRAQWRSLLTKANRQIKYLERLVALDRRAT